MTWGGDGASKSLTFVIFGISRKMYVYLDSFQTRKIKLEFDFGFPRSLEEEDGVGVAGPLWERLPRRLEGRLRAHVRHRLQAPSVLAQVLQVGRRIYYYCNW